jgi:hypothetical protein
MTETNMHQLNKKHNQLKKYLVISLILLIAAGVLVFALETSGVTNFVNNKATDEQTSDVNPNDINYEPPTEEEKNSGDEQKDDVLKDEEQRNDPDNQNKQTASVIITDAKQYDDIIEVRSFIPNHYEDGTCTITFTKDSQSISKDTPAYRDASTTICTNPLFNRSEFPGSGDWNLVVYYKSTGASGQSSITTVKIE